MLSAPIIPILHYLQDTPSESLQELLILRIVRNNPLTTARKAVSLVVKAVVVDLSVQVVFCHSRSGDVLQNVLFSQSAIHEEINPNALIGRHDLQVAWFLYGRNEACDLANGDDCALVTARLFGEGLLQGINIWICALTNPPEELGFFGQLMEVLVSNADIVKVDFERLVEE